MVGFEKALGAVKVIKDQIQCRSQSLLNLARDYFRVVISCGHTTKGEFPVIAGTTRKPAASTR